jgi:hypothetical protein
MRMPLIASITKESVQTLNLKHGDAPAWSSATFPARIFRALSFAFSKSLPTMTSVALIMANAFVPGCNPSLSTLGLVMTATISAVDRPRYF